MFLLDQVKGDSLDLTDGSWGSDMPGGSRNKDRFGNKGGGIGIGGVIGAESEMFASFVVNYDAQEFRKCHSEFVSQLKHKHLLYPLVGEIDRCLKKVSEGVESVEDVWQKLISSTLPNQKEKYETDLKKEIKKLQRLREQIKAWIASTDIKDKTMLVDTKKLIETQMERFKGIEREMKIKTYSKVGLGSAPKVDPIAQESDEVHVWICDWMDKLEIQIDHFESEIESLMASEKRRGQADDDQERIDQLQINVERHKFHIDKLEILMRMLDELGSDVDYSATRIKKFLNEVRNIKEDIDYYLQGEDDPNFKDSAIYDEIEGMDEFEQSTTNISFINAPSAEEVANGTESDTTTTSSGVDRLPHSDEWNTSSQEHSSTFEDPSKSKPRRNGKVVYEDRNNNHFGEPKKCCTYPAPTSSFKDVVSGRVSALSTHATGHDVVKNGVGSNIFHISVSTSGRESEERDQCLENRSSSDPDSPFSSSEVNSTVSSLELDLNCNASHKRSSFDNSMFHTESHAKAIEEVLAESNCQRLLSHPFPNRTSDEYCQNIPPSLPLIKEARIPPLLAAAPLGHVPLSNADIQRFKMLEVSAAHMPLSGCTERLGQLLPREAWPLPSYYPQKPVPFLSMSMCFKQFDLETLFFIFYYAEGSKGQYLAAKELKERMWRFHTKYLTWYQRHEMPTKTTEDYEYGTYVYFDIEKWAQRKKENFLFEYRFLENDF